MEVTILLNFGLPTFDHEMFISRCHMVICTVLYGAQCEEVL